ncbi:hypothetical protein BKA70DRAFT_1443027 [Coprinopsis sp. MPI-PUGE-AT-0042]|nr:hypothetical protein BKA70DRAFT_1443027 [Coprinopsis sp. MPI-PUGE-AT-0042]
MVDLNKLLPTARLVVFSIVCVLSLIDLPLRAISFLGRPHIMVTTTRSRLWDWQPLSSPFSHCPVMYWLSVSRKGAFTSYVVTEVAWVPLDYVDRHCWFLHLGELVSGSVASEAQAFEAFAFINWFALLFYTTTLFVVAIISHSKGHSAVWTSAVKDFDFNSAVSQSAIPAPMQQQQPLAPQAGYAPQAAYTPQHTGSGFAGQPHGTPQQAPVAMV